MSIANGTTYYDYPQVQLTDRPTFADYNPAFSDIDAKLYALITGAITDESDIASLKEDMAQAKLDIVAAQGTADRADGKADTNAENITLLQGSVGAIERDVATKLYSVAIAEPYDATSGTYNVGDVVVYNGQRYVCTTAVAVAEPFDADKWTGEDVQEVLDDITGDVGDISSLTTTTKTDCVSAINEIMSDLTGTNIASDLILSPISPTAYTNCAINTCIYYPLIKMAYVELNITINAPSKIEAGTTRVINLAGASLYGVISGVTVVSTTTDNNPDYGLTGVLNGNKILLTPKTTNDFENGYSCLLRGIVKCETT